MISVLHPINQPESNKHVSKEKGVLSNGNVLYFDGAAERGGVGKPGVKTEHLEQGLVQHQPLRVTTNQCLPGTVSPASSSAQGSVFGE